jgi:hypothetical protein
MGSSESPRIFSKVVKAAVYHARALGLNVFSYIDDTLQYAESYEKSKENSFIFAELLIRLGFLLHPKKSVLEPTQQILYLGFIIDSTTMMLRMTDEKFEKMQDFVKSCSLSIHSEEPRTIRSLAKAIGFIISLLPATKYGKAHYRSLETARNFALGRSAGNFDASCTIPSFCLQDLTWWQNLKQPIQNTFASRQFSAHFTTDASMEGWAGVFGSKKVSGIWDEVDDQVEIAFLELKAVYLALQAFFRETRNATIHLSIDNTVAMAYVNHMGGRIPRYDALARRIWRFLEERDMFIVASFVPSHKNKADYLTRLSKQRLAWRFQELEFQLLPKWFNFACKHFKCRPTIDWFASDDNAQIPRFCAWESAKRASCFDAFAYSWSVDISYIFPPFALIPRVLAKIKADKATGILVVPYWTGAPWWSQLQTIARSSFLIPESDPYRYPTRPTLKLKKELSFTLIKF